ncbi:hypothetical protein ERX37_00500 [Macrococcus hajekii]|uniref:Enolase C-terminal domain-containing protein n=1 Tax=Macrococcus hajekii TaxID=198482 RepID=A0A4R6BLL6_9STAP|nr:enolase C-terminal domain-like protein [Macrococcus hajekii]TDM02601.1 hypothetical protein ERX37_00500 [Macrococcus hajekii]GGB02340.1 o-succinylbenzoate synthase [Macrococcus hajekii]
MRFSNLKCFTFTAPFKTPIRTVKADMTERKVLIISLEVDGETYYAESNAFETDWYHEETIESVHAAVKKIFAAIKDKEWTDYTTLGSILAYYRSTPHAIALFDYIGWQSLNDCKPVTVPLGYTLHPGQQLELQNRVKLKWHDDIVNEIKKIRLQYADIKIVVDANGSLSEDDVPTLEAMADDVDYFEELFSDIALYAKYSHLPLAIDESATNIEAIIRYYGVGVRIIVAKYARLGGGYPIKAIKEAIPDMRIIAGGMYEFGLSKYFTAQLAAEFGTIPDLTPRGTYFSEDYATYEEIIENGQLMMTYPVVDVTKLQEIINK